MMTFYELVEIYMMKIFSWTDIMIAHLCITWDNLNKGDPASSMIFTISVIKTGHKKRPVQLRRDCFNKEGA